MARRSVWSSNNLLNSAIAGVSIRPLSANTVNGPRAALSILKVIGQATSLLQLRRKAFLLSERRAQVVQPSTQLDFTENKARKRNWSARLLESARILGIKRGNVCRPTIGMGRN